MNPQDAQKAALRAPEKLVATHELEPFKYGVPSPEVWGQWELRKRRVVARWKSQKTASRREARSERWPSEWVVEARERP
jgi:hypothetical protein